MTRIVAFVLACVGQVALWASPMFACACGPGCAERRAATATSPPSCCETETNFADAKSDCCCSGDNRVRPEASRSGPAPACVGCMSDEHGSARCGQCSGGAEGGSCGCFHGPNFEIASQSVPLRSFVPFELPSAFFFPAATETAQDAFELLRHGGGGGLVPRSSSRIQAVLCVWRK